ncbi:hypothetical protein [Planococcus salinus]|uniref:Uncharacterized protein n=1 Tax=Planococcus salinus TaxID=1848460 RepID=A0A3M8P5B0_9BACL|nr:hypothetical protein [Planococcus salinus]RNF38835.1 hypothetical protein EEX84_11985 [Planococcus salinus]
METAFEIVLIVLPIVAVGAIALFVINRLKQKRDALGKKKSASAQDLLDSLIPVGMIFGSALGIIFSLFFPISLAIGIVFGASIGLLGGYFAYEFYSKKEESRPDNEG